MGALGIIFSDVHSWNVAEITANRTIASIPFGGRYRLVDFLLSNMVNSGIYKVGLITKSNYQSLIDHIASGKEWDLSRKNGGIVVLPPYGIGNSAGQYKGRLDALKRIKRFIESSTQEYVVLADCDIVANIDYSEIIRAHIKNRADITAVYSMKELSAQQASHSIIYNSIDETGRITDMLLYPETEGKMPVALNVWVMSKERLLYLISDAATHGLTHFSKNILLDNVSRMKIVGYEHTGYSAHIESLTGYMESNMDLINRENRMKLFGIEGQPIHTKVRDSAPTKYSSDAVVKNSLIADGCVIEGTVENSILMQDTLIEDGASLSWIICDKNVIVRDNRVLAADKSYPFYIAKSKMI